MNWAAFPLLRVTLLLITGIITFEIFNLPMLQALAGLIFSLFLYIIIYFTLHTPDRRSMVLGSLILSVSFFLGGFLIGNKNNNIHSEKSKDLTGKLILITGVVDEAPVLKNRLRTFVNVTSAGFSSDHLIPLNIKTIVYFDRSDSVAARYEQGDLILMRAKINEVTPGTNPYAFDYSEYLRYRSVIHQISVPAGNHRSLSKGNLNGFQRLAIQSRLQCLETLQRYIKDERKLAVSQAILLGYRNLISDDLYQDFTDTGAIHVLAVSGLHVAIVISFFVLLLDKIRSRSLFYRIFRMVTLLLIVWFYVVMTGASPAVQRAGLMVSFYIVGKNVSNHINIYNILSISAIFLLMYDPFLLFQASFQFSYLALISIVYFQPYISQIYQPSSYILNQVWNLVSVAIAAQILVFPITIFYFHKFPIYFMLTGLVAVPLVYVILYLGLVLLAFEALLPAINFVIHPVFSFVLDIFLWLIVHIRQLPYSSIKAMWMDGIGLFLLYMIVISLMFYLVKRHILWFRSLLGLSFIYLFYFLYTDYQASKQSKIYVYDVFGGYLIDFFDGKTCFTLKSDDLSPKSENFASQNNRMMHRIEEIKDITKEFSVNGVHFEKAGNFVRNGNILFYLYKSGDYKEINKVNFKLDYCYIPSGKYKSGEWKEFHQNVQNVILDRNLRYWQSDLIWDSFSNYSIGIHDVKNDGSLKINNTLVR
ncbi:MAG: ComEC family competence protein [Saprospiraceae bacterium]|nr:ComEC family competence protein [Saprospiraceae bacterium]